MFYCARQWWLNGGTPTPQEQAMPSPKPFRVLQPIPGENPKPLFVIHAYSLEQARALAARQVAGETIVVGPVSRDGANQ